LMASFQKQETGLEHQIEMPADVPTPDSLPPRVELIEAIKHHMPETLRAFWQKQTLVDVRPTGIKHYTTREKLPPVQHVWMRITEQLPDDPAMNAALLAYLSDMTLLDVSTYAHGRTLFDEDIQSASLDHAMWFHRPFNLNDWLLTPQTSPFRKGSLGLSRAAIIPPDGCLVPLFAQEGLCGL